MFRQIVQIAGLCTAGLAGLSGCSTEARYVTVNNSGGVVAIPSDTNDWPTHYRKQAEDLMQARCPGGYVIEDQGPYIISSHHTTSATSGDPMQAAPPGTPMAQRNRDGSIYSDKTEWRIYFRRVDAPPGSALALKPLPQTEVAPIVPVLRAVTLTPTGTPLQTLPTPLAVGPNLMPTPINGGRPPGLPGMPDN